MFIYNLYINFLYHYITIIVIIILCHLLKNKVYIHLYVLIHNVSTRNKKLNLLKDNIQIIIMKTIDIKLNISNNCHYKLHQKVYI